MVAEFMVTVCPVMIEVLSRFISEPEVPTVKPVTMSVPPVAVLIRAAAAVPVAEAVTDLGKPENVNTALAAVPAVLFRETEAKILAMPVVPISRTPVVPMAVTTADKREFLTAVV